MGLQYPNDSLGSAGHFLSQISAGFEENEFFNTHACHLGPSARESS